MNHQRGGDQGEYGYGYAYVDFTADATVPFSLSGFYQADDVDNNDPGYVRQYAYLYDFVAGYLFDNLQYSTATTDEKLTLGETGGDGGNNLYSTLNGNLEGTLIQGRQYRLHYSSYIRAYPDSDAGASGAGHITLQIGNVASAPEPLSCLVWGGLAIAGAVARSRLKRS